MANFASLVNSASKTPTSLRLFTQLDRAPAKKSVSLAFDASDTLSPMSTRVQTKFSSVGGGWKYNRLLNHLNHRIVHSNHLERIGLGVYLPEKRPDKVDILKAIDLQTMLEQEAAEWQELDEAARR